MQNLNGADSILITQKSPVASFGVTGKARERNFGFAVHRGRTETYGARGTLCSGDTDGSDLVAEPLDESNLRPPCRSGSRLHRVVLLVLAYAASALLLHRSLRNDTFHWALLLWMAVSLRLPHGLGSHG